LYKDSETGSFDIDDIWKMSKKNFWTILLTGFGYLIIVTFVSIFLIIPGIYFAVALSIIFIVRLEEGLGFFDAVKRCTKIISGNWWFTFGLIIVIGMIQGFLGFILYMPNYIVTFFLAFAGVDSYSGSLGKILYILSSIIASIGALLYTISTTAIAFQYFNLVERKEAPGLLHKIENIR
jgi:hypothetical protein